MANESKGKKALAALKEQYSEKFVSINEALRSIHRGDRIFVHTACGEPQYLLRSLVEYIESEPKAVFDAEVLQVWSLGLAPYAQEKFKKNFRHNSFFIGNSTRNAVNSGLADYTPIFLSEIPKLFQRGHVPVDVALIQASCPDPHGYMSLGVSVDIVKAATEKAQTIIVQINPQMPRVHGDGFIHISDVNYVIYHDEPLLEYEDDLDNEVADRIGKYVANLIEDGNTIQVGYGCLPNAILANLKHKKHLGVHTELLGDGLVKLMKLGVIDNSKKTINRGKTIATFSMGSKATYEYLHDNPFIEFKTVDYTNDPRVIAQHDNMTAINSALEIDLTGQATAESLGKVFYSGIGGQADFMRGAILAKKGKTILTIPSTAENGEVSRIAPFLKSGAGVTLNRGDVHYVVTEYGIAYLHGKNIRERAMELISIAHPKFRADLIKQAKKGNLIYQDQAYIAGKAGEYPEKVETYRTTSSGLEVFIRPVKISDESLLKDFFYSLSDASLQRRFISERKDMPHERLQDFVVIDYTSEIILLAFTLKDGVEQLVGLGQYAIIGSTHTADVAFVIRDDHQELGIGKELLKYLTLLAKKQGLLGFTADVIISNARMMRLFESMGFDVQKHISDGMYEMKMTFLESK
ncbi:MAG: GNAT family N-acetyltransferase [Candidatus Marinimicrobia bacterium]|nr:GNAT family N-acetyltransferase [Candidatus Neomarinimicrobiota bacterium]MCF7922244.1 GNAT family N-acetyltransferase [Candidatus Neomarinimicrobiota bacterium]